MPHNARSNADEMMNELKPDFINLLESAPDFGSCTLEVIYHEGKIVRVITKKEVSKKVV